MKICLRFFCFFIFYFLLSFGNAQTVFWTEDFGVQNCSSQNTLATSYTGINGTWTETVFGTQGAKANIWFVSSTEAGFPAGTCGDGCLSSPSLTNKTLHLGCQSVIIICSTGDCGAAYNAGGLGNVTTNKRAESPAINCAGYSNITLSFNYIEEGQGTSDDASVYYFDGTSWILLVNTPKTTNGGCGGQGLWTAYSIALPASANNNSNVKIGFLWVNNNDATGTDPSFAVDDVKLSVPSGGSLPVVSFSASDTTICAGDCINFFGSATNGPILSWVWTFTGGLPASAAVQNPTGICYNTAGNYSVTLTATNGTGPGTLTKTSYIVVTAMPAVTVAPSSTTICLGNSDTLIASGATSYTWTPSTGLNTTTNDTVIASPTVPTTYTVTGTTNGCTGSAMVFVNVTPAIIPDAGHDTSICQNSSVILHGSGGTGYSWSPSTNLSCTNCQDPVATPGSTITYTVTVSSGSCIPATDAVSITVQPAITADAGIDDSICPGDTAFLLATGGGSYTWTPVTNLSCTNCPNPQATPSANANYTVTVTLGICSASDAVAVNVLISPNANAGSNVSICAGDSTQLNASGGSAYLWNPPAGLSCTNCPNPYSQPVTTMTYTVTVSNGICAASDDVIVTVNPIPVAGISGNTNVCEGSSTVLTASGGTSYSWSTGASTNPITLYPTGPASYTVTVSNAGCTDEAFITVNVFAPVQVFAGNDTSILIGDSVQLHATGGTSWTWSPATGLSCTNCQNPVASPLSTTTYQVIAIDANLCQSTDEITITVDDHCGAVYIPTIFSPNGDHNNDVLRVRGNCIETMEFTIYDRWGEKIFTATSPGESWDGKFHGKDLNVGVYTFNLSATLYDKSVVKKKGTVTLIR